MTNLEEKFIIENYSQYGPSYCSKALNLPLHQVSRKASEMGIKKIGRAKHPSEQNIDPRQFWNVESNTVAYFLGFFWSDGYIHRYSSRNTSYHRIALEIISDDFCDLESIFSSLGKWSKQIRKRKESWKETTTIVTNSKDLYEFLSQYGYNEKSNTEPDLILKNIPPHLHPYFWRGLIDGDGHIGYSIGSEKKGKLIQISGLIDYKWASLSALCESLEVKYHIYRYANKKGHSHSIFNITTSDSLENFIQYLLKSELGLSRKTEKLNGCLQFIRDRK